MNKQILLIHSKHIIYYNQPSNYKVYGSGWKLYAHEMTQHNMFNSINLLVLL